VKTTLNLDDNLMRAARDRARRDGLTLTALISDALRKMLAEPPPAAFRLDLPVTHGRRLPAVDIDSNAAVEEYLDRLERRTEPA
jgi:Bacterial antitoxin of type II TA system, VapB